MFKCLSIILCCVLLSTSIVLARTASGHQYQSLTNRPVKDSLDKSTESNFWNDFSLLYKIYQHCSKENLSVCLKVKLLAGLEKASRSGKEFSVLEGIKFIKDESVSDNSPVMNENEIEASLPRSLDDKDSTLNNLIFNKVLSFVKSHTLQVKFPENEEMDERSEGRKKKDKKGGNGAMIMIPMLLGGTIIPIAYGALALLAGKALIVSKLALVLASIIGIKKLLSGGHKEEVVVSGHSSSGWGRDFDLAYNAYNPKNKDPSKTM